MDDTPTTNTYWRNKPGAEYHAQQISRSSQGNASYRLQEQWLLARLHALSAHASGPLRVLDFGCGFGRFAHLLAGVPGLAYYGFDGSPTMVQPLLDDPPAGLSPVSERVRVGDGLRGAFGDTRFDVIFTVSVLIHNPTPIARTLVEQMRGQLAAGGRILLIENAVSAFSMKENAWHSGCWIHDVAGDLATGFDLTIDNHSVPPHGIYELTPCENGGRLMWIDEHGDVRPCTRDAVRLAGLARTEAGVRSLEAESTRDDTQAGHAYDNGELLRIKERTVSAVTERAEQAEARLQQAVDRALGAEARYADRIRLREGLAGIKEAARRTSTVEHGAVRPQAGESPRLPVELNAPRDLAFTRQDPRFARVAHVFHQDWVGIRSACGVLPGTKVAIPSTRAVSMEEAVALVDALQAGGIDRIALHGMSESMFGLARALHRTGRFLLCNVWHGSAAMWINEPERKAFALAMTLLRQGIVRRFHGIRCGMARVVDHPGYYVPQLLNPVPNARLPELRAKRATHARAFSPSWNLLHKNLAANLAAAHLSDRIGEVWTTADDLLPACIPGTKHKRVAATKPAEVMQAMACVDVVLNVSLVDCHPMIDLEALAVGTPCIRGPLFLDALESHPYIRLTEVANPLSIDEIAQRIDAVLTVPSAEMRATMDDYARSLNAIALDRYADFLEL